MQREGPPAERLREQLEREFGEVPPGTPLEEDPPPGTTRDEEPENGGADRGGGGRTPDDEAEDVPEDDG